MILVCLGRGPLIGAGKLVLCQFLSRPPLDQQKKVMCLLDSPARWEGVSGSKKSASKASEKSRVCEEVRGINDALGERALCRSTTMPRDLGQDFFFCGVSRTANLARNERDHESVVTPELGTISTSRTSVVSTWPSGPVRSTRASPPAGGAGRSSSLSHSRARAQHLAALDFLHLIVEAATGDLVAGIVESPFDDGLVLQQLGRQPVKRRAEILHLVALHRDREDERDRGAGRTQRQDRPQRRAEHEAQLQ